MLSNHPFYKFCDNFRNAMLFKITRVYCVRHFQNDRVGDLEILFVCSGCGKIKGL